MTTRRPRLPGPDLRGARTQAYALAMAPFLFQAARAARDLGLFALLQEAGAEGADIQGLLQGSGLPQTSLSTLLDALLAGDLVDETAEGNWRLTTVGLAWSQDPRIFVEAEFTHTVCWHGLADLTPSLAQASPVGLRRFGPWSTIYEGLASLDEDVRRAWFAYDHGHSDAAFPRALDILQQFTPQSLLDVGANTGRFALSALRALPDLHCSLLDHPGQLREAQTALAEAQLLDRASLMPLDLLDHQQAFPAAHDAVWMSQFLDCFAPQDVTALLRRARAALAPGGSVWVLEVCPDRQQEEAARICLRLASLYFTAIANGVSRFYRTQQLLDCAGQAGLRLDQIWDGIGSAHSLFRFVADEG